MSILLAMHIAFLSFYYLNYDLSVPNRERLQDCHHARVVALCCMGLYTMVFTYALTLMYRGLL